MTIAFGIAMMFFAVFYTQAAQTATPEMRYLYFAIVVSISGIILHFIKKIPSIRKNKALEMWFDCVELLALVASPIAISFQVLTIWYPNNTDYKILLATGTMFLWFLVTMWRTSREENKEEGKATEALSSLLYGFILFVIGIGVYFAIIF